MADSNPIEVFPLTVIAALRELIDRSESTIEDIQEANNILLTPGVTKADVAKVVVLQVAQFDKLKENIKSSNTHLCSLREDDESSKSLPPTRKDNLPHSVVEVANITTISNSSRREYDDSSETLTPTREDNNSQSVVEATNVTTPGQVIINSSRRRLLKAKNPRNLNLEYNNMQQITQDLNNNGRKTISDLLPFNKVNETSNEGKELAQMEQLFVTTSVNLFQILAHRIGRRLE